MGQLSHSSSVVLYPGTEKYTLKLHCIFYCSQLDVFFCFFTFRKRVVGGGGGGVWHAGVSGLSRS